MSDVKSKSAGNLGLLLDYGPLIAFFVASKFSGAIFATGIFMASMIVAIAVSKWRLGRISPMLWLSAVLVIGFGSITVLLQNCSVIQHKPTAIYAGLGILLLVGFLRGKSLLKYVLEVGFEGLNDRAWLVLARNWAIFFIAMAALNEILVLAYPADPIKCAENLPDTAFDTWLSIKVYALIPLSIAFGVAHVPYMMKNGLGGEAEVPPAS